MIDETFRTAPGPPSSRLFNPVGTARNLGSGRELIWQFTRRDFGGKYRAFHVGTLSCVLSPVILPGVYTFIFSVVLQIKGRAWHKGKV